MKQALSILLFILIISANPLMADTFFDSLQHADHHHTPWEILSGNGDDSIVCYKQAHRNIYFLISGLILIIAAITARLLIINKRSNKLLRAQNEIIEEKNKSITDSINYAKRLQNAILPPKSIVNNILPSHFILYCPKDIVSGDFYWVSHHDTKFMVAAVDCTGHGVPGALLSVVGHNALHQTVNELGITQPSNVLDSMNTIIKNILHQDKESDIKDGMDMALCTFNKETMTLEYAGANNPLYIVSDKVLNIVKPSRLTVGSVEESVVAPPQNHSIKLKKGDCFYIFSDGYADQFGGPNNKKFKTSRLQELLVEIHDKPMQEQQQLVLDAFNSWKGKYEQVDDVLVIGIKV